VKVSTTWEFDMHSLFIMLAFLSFTSLSEANVVRTLASIKEDTRIDHARELLGNRYKKSIVSSFEQKVGLEQNILETVTKNLPKAFKKDAHSIAEAIIEESAKHHLDPYFVMAVISGESSFNPLAVGPVGEIGMMQIRPTTGKWMAQITKSKYIGDRTLRDPVQNIKLGTAYLAWLREKFDGQAQLYLASYNMGAKSVRKAVGRNIWPKDYPRHVMKRYLAFYKEI
jgi:membrane-bound lytic murein transglycosylase MltF